MTPSNPGILKYLEALMLVGGENRSSFGCKVQLFRKARAPWVSGTQGCTGLTRGAEPRDSACEIRRPSLSLPCSVGDMGPLPRVLGFWSEFPSQNS